MPANEKTKTSIPEFAFIDSPTGVEEFVHRLNDSPSIALDTEGASFHRYVDRVYLIQLSGKKESAIIDPLAMETPPALGELLEKPDIEVVLHDADYDLRLLHQDYGWTVNNVFDTRVAAQLMGIRAFGLGALLEQFFGIKLDKKFQRADWSMRPLSSDMLAYAVLDTSHLLALRGELAAGLEQLGRTAWAVEEFKRIEGTRWDDSDDADAYLRMKGARDLTRPQLAILRELVDWRDAVAREMDRAVFRVIGNEPLLEIAQSSAATLEEVSKIKGVPRSLAGRKGDAMLAAIERGRSTPPDKMPRFPKAKRWDKDPKFDDRVARLRAARDAAALRLNMDPGVLCSRERLEAIARKAPASIAELSQVEGIRRWQVAELGDAFLAAL